MIKKKFTKTKRGFTMIEMLVVIAIMGVLSSIVLTALKSARQKALIASWKSSVASSLPGAVLCCSASKTLQSVAGAEICEGEASWPETDKIGGIVIGSSCSLIDSNFQYTITGPSSDITDNCQPVVCNQNGCTFTPVSGDHFC